MTESRISHGAGQMRAQSISIQVSTRERCNAGCRFCISRTTQGVSVPEKSSDIKLCDDRRLRVGLNYAKQLGATHAILTSRADPTQEDDEYLACLVRTAREYLPLADMHTNGYLLLPGKPKKDLLRRLVDEGLTMITFSIASFNPAKNRELMIVKEGGADLIGTAKDLGLLVRCSLVVNSLGVQNFAQVIGYVRQAGSRGAHMVVVREVWVPEVYGTYDQEVYDWNREHRVRVPSIQEEFMSAAADKKNPYGIQLRDPLPWGTPVFAVSDAQMMESGHGVNVTFALCEEATVGPVLKSIVHKPNGHGYRNWDHNGDILY